MHTLKKIRIGRVTWFGSVHALLFSQKTATFFHYGHWIAGLFCFMWHISLEIMNTIQYK